jgi:hypothetical protein
MNRICTFPLPTPTAAVFAAATALQHIVSVVADAAAAVRATPFACSIERLSYSGPAWAKQLVLFTDATQSQ